MWKIYFCTTSLYVSRIIKSGETALSLDERKIKNRTKVTIMFNLNILHFTSYDAQADKMNDIEAMRSETELRPVRKRRATER